MGENITKKNIINSFKNNNILLEGINIDDGNLNKIKEKINKYIENYSIRKRTVIHNIIFQILSKKNKISNNYQDIINTIINKINFKNNIDNKKDLLYLSTIYYIIDNIYNFDHFNAHQ